MLRFIDLFAGMGGFRKGFEEGCKELNIETECVLTSEIKKSAIKVYKDNYVDAEIVGDIREIDSKDIVDFDVLLAGFPCQTFSTLGKRAGFEEERGMLFFEVLRILREKQPKFFILENVEGLVIHNKENKSDKIGKTFETILTELKKVGYNVKWQVIDSRDWVAQSRKRVYIVGKLGEEIEFNIKTKGNDIKLKDIREYGLDVSSSEFINKLLSRYKLRELGGKKITDKRGGTNNIHSWNIGVKGNVTKEEEEFLDKLLTERRKKKYIEKYHLDNVDGVPLTYEDIQGFSNISKDIVEGLVEKGYIVKEKPKRRKGLKKVTDESLPIGYNIVAGALSYEILRILSDKEIVPTMTATEMSRIYVIDKKGLRRFSKKESLRLFGYSDDYKVDVNEQEMYDLLGNTVVVPIIKEITKNLMS